MIKGSELLEKLSPQVAEKLIQNQEQINQLHETLSTLRLDKQNALVRRLVRKTQDGTLGQPGDSEGEAEAGEEAVDGDAEKVTFGDTNNTYTITEQAKEAVSKAAPSILPYVLAAALGGSGLGAAAMALPLLLKPATPVIVEPSSMEDTNTQYDLQFKEENP